MATAIIQRSETTDLLGQREDVLSFAKRIKVMVKGGEKLSDNEAMALAQVSLVTKLNPFIGEVWYIPGKGPMVGIAGARRYNNEQAANGGGYSFPEFTPVSAEEAGAKPGENVSHAFRCDIFDSVAISQYQRLIVETINSLRAAGSKDPFGDAREIIGPKPKWTGFGYSTVDEQSRMNKMQLAKKRAEADGLKQRIVIPFGGEVSTEDASPQVVEGEITPTEMSEKVDEVFPEQTAYNFNSSEIVQTVAKGLGYDNETTLQTLKELHTQKRVGDKMTKADADAIIKELTG